MRIHNDNEAIIHTSVRANVKHALLCHQMQMQEKEAFFPHPCKCLGYAGSGLLVTADPAFFAGTKHRVV